MFFEEVMCKNLKFKLFFLKSVFFKLVFGKIVGDLMGDEDDVV